MNWDSRIEHWQEAGRLFEMAMRLHPGPARTETLAIVQIHVTAATISETFGGTLDSLAHRRERRPGR